MKDLVETDRAGSITDADRADAGTTPGISVRVSLQSYLAALFLGTFFSSLLLYLEFDTAGVILFGLTSILIPGLALGDRVRFDGKRIVRTGILPVTWARLNANRHALKLADIEQVETHTYRAIRRGENITYRYRTVIRGKGLSISISSGGEDFRRMLKAVLPGVSENALDTRSIELRDHLQDPKETLMRAEFSRIPAADVLEGSFKSSNKKAGKVTVREHQPEEETFTPEQNRPTRQNVSDQ